MRLLRTVLCATVVLAAPHALRAQADEWWHHVTVLAHDSMRGRETGSPEHQTAAIYVASEFRRAGLAPLTSTGFLQSVPFIERRIDEDKSSVELVRDKKREKLVLGQDVSFVTRAPLAKHVEAPVAFVGYGLHLPELGHDDLAGIDLQGKIVVYLSGMPKGLPGAVVSHARAQAWPAFRERGAVGMIVFSGSPKVDTTFIRAERNRLRPQMALGDPKLDTQRGNKTSLQFNAARGEKLFAGSPQRFATLIARSDSGLPLPHFDLAVRVRTTTSTSERPITSDNVAGVLPGHDDVLQHEYVVLTAHLDHIGVGAPVNGDSINNGAMDNASGVALLIQTARALSVVRDSLRRSVLFLAVTGEEKGLLGSRYYANHSTVPANGTIIANLNTDMFLPLMPFRLLMVNGLEESDLADDVRRVGQAMGVEVITDPEPEENRFVRSDQYSFILRGVPALSLKVGFRRDSPEHELVKKFRADRYHQPSDDLNQPVDRQAAADFSRTYVELVKAVANRPTRPAWYPTSFFAGLQKTSK